VNPVGVAFLSSSPSPSSSVSSACSGPPPSCVSRLSLAGTFAPDTVLSLGTAISPSLQPHLNIMALLMGATMVIQMRLAPTPTSITRRRRCSSSCPILHLDLLQFSCALASTRPWATASRSSSRSSSTACPTELPPPPQPRVPEVNRSKCNPQKKKLKG